MRQARVLPLLLFASLSLSAATLLQPGTPSTTNNDDSCDIALFPAATLLLPYFEVDFNAPQGNARTTLFTVVNTVQTPQIARVTIWTDWAYPVLNFDIFLTGYDVQAVNLYDVLGPRGIVPATSSNTPPGARSLDFFGNANLFPGAGTACGQLPGAIPANILADVRTALTTGRTSACGVNRVGGTHTNAIGYVTIDLVATCGPKFATEAGFFDQLLYDNVLSGDYQWINPDTTSGNYAGGNPLVHIRALPEGGPAGTITRTNLPYTFYDRYTPNLSEDSRAMDRRQPLPSAFASRYIQGGTGSFNTDFAMWREGVVGSGAFCSDYIKNISPDMKTTSEVRFDEHENPTTLSPQIIISAYIPYYIIYPAASSTPTSSSQFPVMSTSGDVAGWLYINLNNGGSSIYSAKSGRPYNGNSNIRQNQNWIVTSMSAEGRFQATFDATMLANGCTPAPDSADTSPIGPGPNTTP